MMKLLVSVSEAAEALSLSRSKVYLLIAARQLAVVKVGKSTRIERQELERFIASLREGADEVR